MVKRVIKGHTQAKPAMKVEVAIFLPKDLFYRVRMAYYHTAPDNVSFSAFVVALIEAGMEVAE